MKSSFYRGDIAKLVKIYKKDPVKFETALKKEHMKTAKSLDKFKAAELISIINDLNTIHQLTDELSKEKDQVIKMLQSLLKEYFGDIYKESGPFGGTLGKVFKLLHEQNSHYKELNAVTIQLKAKALKNSTNLAVGRNIAVANSKAKAQTLGEQLEQAIRDYFRTHHKPRNDEIFIFLRDKGFLGEKGYKDSTLEKKIRVIAAKCRKESSGQ